MPKLTLCMIVKNEEDVLARCLGSVTGKNPQPDYAGDAPKTRTERSACPIDEIVFRYGFVENKINFRVVF